MNDQDIRRIAAEMCKREAWYELRHIPFEEQSVDHRHYWMKRARELVDVIEVAGFRVLTSE